MPIVQVRGHGGDDRNVGVTTWFQLAGGLVTVAGAFLRYDGYRAHDLVGRFAEAIGAVDLVVAGAIGQQRAAEAGVDCQVFGRCEGMPDNWWELFAPLVEGAALGGLIAGAAVACGWVLAALTRRGPGGK